MSNTNQHFLSDKYEFLRTLGSGSFSTVYLVRHKTLELERAVKVIPRTSSDQLSVLAEARLLQSLQHPGIPKIYDIEEDPDNYYLIQEYIRGISLEEFLQHHLLISQDLFYNFIRQLCDIYIYLHTCPEHPVLYQDLKPAHIIVCGNQMKLIDFGASCYITSLGNNFKHFGNMEFSAPENFSDTELTTAADVYSIGKMIQYLQTYLDTPCSRTFQHIIQKATAFEPALRYETVEALWSDIEQNLSKDSQPHLLNHIAVVGSHHGCGTTHFSISLVSTLNYLGIEACYFEKTDTDSLFHMQEVLPDLQEQEGCFYYRYFHGYPLYGAGITLDQPGHAVHVYDYGSNDRNPDISSADLILYICDGAVWHWKDAIEKNEFLNLNKEKLKVICNRSTKSASAFYAKQFSLPVYPYFMEETPFDTSREKALFFKQLLNQKGRTPLYSALRRIFRPHRR